MSSRYSSHRSALNTFAAEPIDRVSHRRDDLAFLQEVQADALEIWLNAEQMIAGINGGERLYLASTSSTPELLEQRWYLGERAQRHYFARVLAEPEPAPELQWLDLRAAALNLPAFESGLAAFARGLQFWHARTQFCGLCGYATVSEQAGHRRRCVNIQCQAQHFPRTDPAIIVAVEFDQRILLGRQASWPPTRYSTLAGFVEPGESLEQAVAREVYEEAGAIVLESNYVSSQPWPFPASLMLGFVAQAKSDELRVGDELEDARYFSVAEFEAAIRAKTLRLSPPVSISYRLIEQWYQTYSGRSLADLYADCSGGSKRA